MGARFQLQIAPLFGGVELVGQCALDVARRGVVTFDQVRVVAVHHPHETSEPCGGTRMQTGAEGVGGPGQRCNEIDDLRALFVEEARLNSGWGFVYLIHADL
jgi:hypothetical protein